MTDVPVTPDDRSRPWHGPALVALCAVLFFFGLWQRSLWDIDEGMHAETARVMLVEGDWLTPTFNGENFYDKPVLFTWMAAASMALFGLTEFAVRLPAALLGTGCVLVTWRLGVRMQGPRTGFLAGAVLATSILFFVLSRVVVHDISLVFAVTLALWCFYTWYTSASRSRWLLAGLYAATGLAVMAKGPLGVVLVAMTIGLFLLVRGQWRLAFRMGVPWGILIILLIGGPWYLLMSLAHDDYARYFFWEKNVGSFVSEESNNPQPLYYYLPILFAGLLPWSGLLPMVLIHACRRGQPALRDGRIFAVVWFLGVFVFFSVATSKLDSYILPLFPAAALLIGSAWQEIIDAPSAELRRGFVVSLTIQGTLTTIVALAALIVPWLPGVEVRETLSMFGIRLADVALLAALVGLAGGAATVAVWCRAYRTSFATTVALVVVVAVLLITRVLPGVDPYRSSKLAAARLDALLPPGEPLPVYRRIDGIADSALFYTGRRGLEVKNPGDLATYFDTDAKVYCLMARRHADHLDRVAPIYTIEERIGNKLILSNAPRAATAETSP